MPTSFHFRLILFIFIFVCAGPARSENGTTGGEEEVAALIAQANAAIDRFDIKIAQILIATARQKASAAGYTGELVAQSFLLEGLIWLVGNNNAQLATLAFQKGLCIDARAEVDAVRGYPEAVALLARMRSLSRERDFCTMAFLDLERGVEQIAEEDRMLRHTPIRKQVRLVPIPFYAEVAGDRAIGGVVLYYRTAGERLFQQVPMARHHGGYGATIGCDVLQTFDPVAVEYYLALFSAEQQLLATSANEARPHVVQIVDALPDPLPRLPGGEEPTRCSEDCPPWQPECAKRCLALGSTCDEGAACCPDSSCVGGICKAGADEKPTAASRASVPKTVFWLNFGTGFGFVGTNVVEPYNANTDISFETGAGTAPDRMHFRVGGRYAIAERLALGATFRGDIAAESKYPDDVPAVVPAGLFNLWYHLGHLDPRVAEVSVLIGIGGGYLQHRLSYHDCAEGVVPCTQELADQKKFFFQKAGPFLLELGLDGYFWPLAYFGINYGLVMNLTAPDFAINFDIHAGVATRF